MIWWQLVMNDVDNDHLCSPWHRMSWGPGHQTRGAGPLGHEVTCHQWPRGQLTLPGTLCAGNRTLYLMHCLKVLSCLALDGSDSYLIIQDCLPKALLTTGSREEEWLHCWLLYFIKRQNDSFDVCYRCQFEVLLPCLILNWSCQCIKTG